jgi:Na+/proline symporter
LSALTLLGMPAEVYTQGTQYFAILFMLPVICFLTGEVYIPVFHTFQLESSYQYLELRFNNLL